MAIKTRSTDADEVDITPMIDIVFQLIIFFMVIMAIAVVYGVAIKFPPKSRSNKPPKGAQNEKRIVVTVKEDRITADPKSGRHIVLKDGILKIGDEEIAMTKTPYSLENYREVWLKWEKERKEALDYLQAKMEELIVKKNYKTDILLVRGDMKTYHGKVMMVIDRGKRVQTGEMEDDPENPGQKKEKIGISGFSLVPPG